MRGCLGHYLKVQQVFGHFSLIWCLLLFFLFLILFSIKFLLFSVTSSLEKLVILSLLIFYSFLQLYFILINHCILKTLFWIHTFWCSIFLVPHYKYSLSLSLSLSLSFGLIFVWVNTWLFWKLEFEFISKHNIDYANYRSTFDPFWSISVHSTYSVQFSPLWSI